MGIRGLERIIKENQSSDCNSIEVKSLKDFSGKYVCIDTSEFIVRSLIKDKNYHVSGILNLLEKCLRNNVIPCFVFDGKPPKEKRNVLNERCKKKKKAIAKIKTIDEESKDILEINDLIERLNDLKNSETEVSSDQERISPADFIDDDNNVENMKYLKREIMSRISSSSSLIDLTTPSRSISTSPVDSDEDVFEFDNTDILQRSFELKLLELSDEKKKMKKKCHNYNDGHINDIKGLLELFSIPYIEASCESDFVCTALCKLGIVDAVISNDMDFIVLGCPVVIRNLNFKDDTVDVYYYKNICKNLGFNSENLVELSMILGCDYCNRIINFKNKFVYDIYKHFNSIDLLKDNLDTLYKYFTLHNNMTLNSNIYSYIESESFNYDNSVDINKIKSMFDIDLNKTELMLLIQNDIDLDNCFYKCKNALLDISSSDNKKLENCISYCMEKCSGLNKQLITKKCYIICDKPYNKYFNNSNLEGQIRNDITQKQKYSQSGNYYKPSYNTNAHSYYNKTIKNSKNQLFIY